MFGSGAHVQQQQRPQLPQALMSALQSTGFAELIISSMPYSNGVIAVITGEVPNDGTVITQELSQGMENTGTTIDTLNRFLLSLDDNLVALHTANPHIDPYHYDMYELVYFTAFLEYLKSFAVNNDYQPPDYISQKLQALGIDPGTFLSLQPISKNMYGMTLLNPPGVPNPHLCPWVFVYNENGKTHIFLDRDEMLQYDKQHGKGILKTVKKAFDRENILYTGIATVSVIGIAIGTGIFIKKRKDKKKEELQKMRNEIESEVED